MRPRAYLQSIQEGASTVFVRTPVQQELLFLSLSLMMVLACRVRLEAAHRENSNDKEGTGTCWGREAGPRQALDTAGAGRCTCAPLCVTGRNRHPCTTKKF